MRSGLELLRECADGSARMDVLARGIRFQRMGVSRGKSLAVAPPIRDLKNALQNGDWFNTIRYNDC